jgi:hypothetical protein
LNLIEAEESDFDVQEDNVDLKDKIVEVIASFNSGSSREHLEIELIEDESVPTIVGTDPSMLRQVISNLLTNAIEHSKERLVSIQRKQSAFLLQHVVLQIHIGSSNFQMGPFEVRQIWKTCDPLTGGYPFPLTTQLRVSVMIAEDNPLQRSSARHTINQRSTWCKGYADGQACFETFKEILEAYVVILMDIQVCTVHGSFIIGCRTNHSYNSGAARGWNRSNSYHSRV